MILPLSSVKQVPEKVKPYIAETTPTLEPDKIVWKPANLSGLALGNILVI